MDRGKVKHEKNFENITCNIQTVDKVKFVNSL